MVFETDMENKQNWTLGPYRYPNVGALLTYQYCFMFIEKKAIITTLCYKIQTNMFSWRTTRTKLSNMKNAFCTWFVTFSIVLHHLIFVYHWWEILLISFNSSVKLCNFPFMRNAHHVHEYALISSVSTRSYLWVHAHIVREYTLI